MTAGPLASGDVPVEVSVPEVCLQVRVTGGADLQTVGKAASRVPEVSVPEVSVIVPARDAAASLGACLDALAACGGPVAEVIVVDNGSRDTTASLARAHPVVDCVVTEPRTGSYAARNAGLAAARGSVLAFTDADCTPHPGWLTAGLAALRAGADVVGGAVVPQRSPQPSVWERYDAALYLRQSEYVAAQGFAATANLFARAAVFAAVSGFDARLRSSGDVEWCTRARAAGFRLAYAPDAVVGHRPRTTLAETWVLHRRLGAGWAALARRGQRPSMWRDPALRLPLGAVVDAVAADGPALRRRQLAPVHAVALAARWAGRLTG